MNPPTDRERPALSEADRALIERVRGDVKPLPVGPARRGLALVPMDEDFLGRLLAAARAEASPKPALTQGGVVELVARKLAELKGHQDTDAEIWMNEPQETAPVWRFYRDDAQAVLSVAPIATALERLAVEAERIAREAFDAALRYALGDRFQTKDRLTLEQREQVFQSILTAHPALGGGDGGSQQSHQRPSSGPRAAMGALIRP